MSQQARRNDIQLENLKSVYVETDQLFFWLLIGQWMFAVAFAALLDPYGWAGATTTRHPNVPMTIVLGGLVNALPLTLIRMRPGWWLTRHVVAAVQMLWSAAFIYLTGGRIETHFHVFVSLACVAFYRDWRVLPTATVVVLADQLVRGLYWPESVYGIANPEWWRILEHAGWILFEDVVLVLACQRSVREMLVDATREATLEQHNADIERQVQLHTSELRKNVERYRSLIENTNAMPWEYDTALEGLSYVAPQAAKFFGCDEADLVADGLFRPFIHPDDRELVAEHVRVFSTQTSTVGDEFDFRVVTADGRQLAVRTILSPRQGDEPLRGITLDITVQKKLESELSHAQKLESVGRLAAGVAHEINTPAQFVNDSVQFLRDAMTDLAMVVRKYRGLHKAVVDGQPAQAAAEEVTEAEQQADLDYLLENIPSAIDRSLDGLNRVTTIVRSMKEFAHPDQKEMSSVNLNQSIQSTLVIARNEYKYVADVETDFGEIPRVICHVGDVNQAVLNIVVNAAHAIGDIVGTSEHKGRITVRTYQDDDSVVIAITDTGGGIPEAVRGRIFDPFFTTKEVGKGTGQGLAIARSVMVDKHGGNLTFETEMGKGTTFLMRLPIDGSKGNGNVIAA